jgi:hypothetical protein
VQGDSKESSSSLSDREAHGLHLPTEAPLRVLGRALRLAAMAAVTIGVSASPARASIAFDASSNTTGAAVTSVSWSHTTANEANRYMVVGVVFSSNSRSISGVTYGSTSLSSLGSINKAAPFHCRAELFGGVPSAGTDTITVSFDGGTVNTVAGATTYYGVSAVVSQTGTTTGTNPSVTVTSTTGDYLVDLVCSADPATVVPSPGQASQVERWKAAVGTFAHGAASNRRGFATSTTMSWTNNNNFAYIPLRLRPMLLNAARVDAIGARRMARQRRGALVAQAQDEVERLGLVDLGRHGPSVDGVLRLGDRHELRPAARLGIIEPVEAEAVAVGIVGRLRGETDPLA